MFTIKKSFQFSAAHWLEELPKEHPCSRLHGHNYIVIVELEDVPLHGPGFVKDYRELEPIKKYIDDVLDHRCLNEILSFNPTAENIAKSLYYHFKGQFPQLSAITVKETEKTEAKFTPLHDSI